MRGLLLDHLALVGQRLIDDILRDFRLRLLLLDQIRVLERALVLNGCLQDLAAIVVDELLGLQLLLLLLEDCLAGRVGGCNYLLRSERGNDLHRLLVGDYLRALHDRGEICLEGLQILD